VAAFAPANHAPRRVSGEKRRGRMEFGGNGCFRHPPESGGRSAGFRFDELTDDLLTPEPASSSSISLTERCASFWAIARRILERAIFLELPHAFAGDPETFADFLEGEFRRAFEPEPQF